jgi:hypothetical protein
MELKEGTTTILIPKEAELLIMYVIYILWLKVEK